MNLTTLNRLCFGIIISFATMISPAHAALSSFYETSTLGYTPLNQAGDTALGTLGIAPATNAIGVYIKANGSQTTDLQQWQDSSASVLSKIDNLGAATFVSVIGSNATASRAAVFDSGKKLISSATTLAELAFVSGVTSAIQTQLNAKQSTTLTTNHILVGASSLAADVAMSGDVGIVAGGATTVSSLLGGAPVNAAFQRACTITSAAAGTAVHCLADADIPSGKKVYLTGFFALVNGGTLWATTATCAIQDTNGTPVNFVTIPVADLTANATVGPWTALVTFGAAFGAGTGGTTAKGLDIKCNANGTGSDLIVTVSGIIK